MEQQGPHVSAPTEDLVERVLDLKPDEFAQWPEAVRDLAGNISAEFFLVRYNPFINPETVYANVLARLRQARLSLSKAYDEEITRRIKNFWRAYMDDLHFREELERRLRRKLPKESVDSRPNTLVECSTDATDLRMALPMMVVSPTTTEEVQYLVKLANEMHFALVPRGGGTGLTGGAIPTSYRTVVLSLSRFKRILDIDTENLILCAQAGVITLTAIKAADEQGLLFTVDPASKAGSSLGGNISGNSGGPFAFEYGTTLDNILVLPHGHAHGRGPGGQAAQPSPAQDIARRGGRVRGAAPGPGGQARSRGPG